MSSTLRVLFAVMAIVSVYVNATAESVAAEGTVCGLGSVEVGACYASGSGDGRTLQLASFAFPSEYDAVHWATNQDIYFHDAWTEFHTDYVFSDHQWAYASLNTTTAGSNVTLMLFVYGNVVNSWIAAGDRDDPIGVMSRIWADMPENVPSGSTLSDQAMSMIPSREILAAEGFSSGSFFYSTSFASGSKDPEVQTSSIAEETVLPTSVLPTPSRTSQPGGDRDNQDDTLAIMNNPERYENTVVNIRGEVYQFGTAEGKLVIAVTDGETYAFTVVFAGTVPGLEVGDVVAVQGVMLDRYSSGYPLIEASRVEIISR